MTPFAKGRCQRTRTWGKGKSCADRLFTETHREKEEGDEGTLGVGASSNEGGNVGCTGCSECVEGIAAAAAAAAAEAKGICAAGGVGVASVEEMLGI